MHSAGAVRKDWNDARGARAVIEGNLFVALDHERFFLVQVGAIRNHHLSALDPLNFAPVAPGNGCQGLHDFFVGDFQRGHALFDQRLIGRLHVPVFRKIHELRRNCAGCLGVIASLYCGLGLIGAGVGGQMADKDLLHLRQLLVEPRRLVIVFRHLSSL